jgi:nicotinate-nucleotide adenylyltransferase
MNPETATRIGILGGTFNPVHLGHLLVAQAAFETLDLAKVLFVPCANPPHKEASILAASEHRSAMVAAAIEDDPRFDVSDVEIRRGGVSYAIDTVRILQSENPDASLHFLVGTDTLPELHLWRHIYSLLPLCSFVAFERPRFESRAIRPEDIHLDPPWPERLLRNILAGNMADISSSDIRHRIAEGLSIRYLVPPVVEMYIAEHRLYEG